MENRKVLKYTCKFLLFIFILISYTPAYAYEISAHKSLHENIIREYERLTGTPILASYRQALLFGAEHEDDDPRYINHFLDPIYNRGFKGKKLSSLQWASNPYAQGNFTHWINDKNTKLFAYPQDYSFERAVYEYVYGDKARAMKSLGHVLHLVEDLTSVPHTRDDSHGGFMLGGASYYENYTSDKKANVRLKSIPKYGSLRELFYQTALFTNENFLSRDTIFEKYAMPKKDVNKIQGQYMYNNIGSKLVFVEIVGEDKNGNKIFASFDLKDDQVLQDYWAHLSRKAVESGVALLGLFFREVEKEKRSNRLAKLNMSYDDAKRVADAYLSYAKSLKSGFVFHTLGKDPSTYFDLHTDELEPMRIVLTLNKKYYKNLLTPHEANSILLAINRYEQNAGISHRSQLASAGAAFDTGSVSNAHSASLAQIKHEQERKQAQNKTAQSTTHTKLSKQKKIAATLNNSQHILNTKQKQQSPTAIQVKPSQKPKTTTVVPGDTPKTKKTGKELFQTNNTKASKTSDKKSDDAGITSANRSELASNLTQKQLQQKLRERRRRRRAAMRRHESAKPSISIKTDTSVVATSSPYTLKGSSSNASSTSLSILDHRYKSNSADWEFTFELQDGENTAEVVAEGHNSSVSTSTVIVADLPPKISVRADCIKQTEGTCYVLPGVENDITFTTDPDVTEFKINEEPIGDTASTTNVTLQEGETKKYVLSAKDAHSQSFKNFSISAYIPKLLINEYMTHRPSGSSGRIDAGWVEIKNNEDFDVNLDGWFLDADKMHKRLKLEGNIPAHGFYIVQISDKYDIQNINSGMQTVEDYHYLDNLYYEPNKHLTLSFGEHKADEVPVSLASDYRFQSFERKNGGGLTRHTCSLKSDIDIVFLQDGSAVSKKYLCQTLGKENENSHYLVFSELASGAMSLEAGHIYLVPYRQSIAAGQELHIPPGVVLKFTGGFDNNDYGAISIAGSLVVEGGSDDPVVFTTANDRTDDAIIAGYVNGIQSINHQPQTILEITGDLSINNAIFRNVKLNPLIYAHGANSIVLSNIHITDETTPADPSAYIFDISANNVTISGNHIQSNMQAFKVTAKDLNFTGNILSVSGGRALWLSVLDNLEIADNDFALAAYEAIYAAHFAEKTNIHGNKGINHLENATDRTLQGVKEFRYVDNTMPLYFPEILHINDMDKFYLLSSNLSFDVDARIFADNVKDLQISDFDIGVAHGGFIFENSKIKLSDGKVHSSGNLHADTKRAEVSAGLSFINSKAQISNLDFYNNDRAAIYAQDSELQVENSSFHHNDQIIINSNSQVSGI